MFWVAARVSRVGESVSLSRTPSTFGSETRALSSRGIRWRESVILPHRVPVHHIPPSLNVVGPAVLVLEIIGVFPNIHAKDWLVAIHERAVLIRGGNDFELPALVLNKPRPAAAETTRPGSCKFLFEIVKAAKGGFDVIGKFAFRFAACVRPHDLPEERMVGMATAVVSHHRANIFRNSA